VDKLGLNTETGEPTRARTSASGTISHAERGLAAARPLVAEIMPMASNETTRQDNDIFIWIPFCNGARTNNDNDHTTADGHSVEAREPSVTFGRGGYGQARAAVSKRAAHPSAVLSPRQVFDMTLSVVKGYPFARGGANSSSVRRPGEHQRACQQT